MRSGPRALRGRPPHLTCFLWLVTAGVLVLALLRPRGVGVEYCTSPQVWHYGAEETRPFVPSKAAKTFGPEQCAVDTAVYFAGEADQACCSRSWALCGQLRGLRCAEGANSKSRTLDWLRCCSDSSMTLSARLLSQRLSKRVRRTKERESGRIAAAVAELRSHLESASSSRSTCEGAHSPTVCRVRRACHFTVARRLVGPLHSGKTKERGVRASPSLRTAGVLQSSDSLLTCSQSQSESGVPGRLVSAKERRESFPPAPTESGAADFSSWFCGSISCLPRRLCCEQTHKRLVRQPVVSAGEWFGCSHHRPPTAWRGACVRLCLGRPTQCTALLLPKLQVFHRRLAPLADQADKSLFINVFCPCAPRQSLNGDCACDWFR